MNNKKLQRQNKLIDIIKKQGRLPIKTLSSMLDVSEMTIRRDLESLTDLTVQADLTGDEAGNAEYSLIQALEKANAQKDRIGKFAASLIQPDDVIIIDTGSTTARILPHIPTNDNLTVLCYNTNVLLELRNKPGIRILFAGGVYHHNTEMFESPEGIQFIKRTRANKVFLSAAGVHRELGITCANSHEVPTKNAIIRSSSEKILVVDSSKFGQLRSAYFCELSDISMVVTDAGITADWQEYLTAKGIVLHIV